MANDLKSKLIVIPTITGLSARLVSNFEPSCPILALTTDENVANSLTLNYGVFAKTMKHFDTTDEILFNSKIEAQNFIELEKNDIIIITGGFNNDKKSKEIVKTNLLKIEII